MEINENHARNGKHGLGHGATRSQVGHLLRVDAKNSIALQRLALMKSPFLKTTTLSIYSMPESGGFSGAGLNAGPKHCCDSFRSVVENVVLNSNLSIATYGRHISKFLPKSPHRL